jgi:hypothetical protein
MPRTNPFERAAYNNNTRRGYFNNPDYVLPNVADQTFSGHDIQAYYNDIKVGNLEQISWTVSTETVGNFAMGQRDPLAHTQGKRVIVGSMVMQQYARHALLQQVFQLHRRAIGTIGDLWNLSSTTSGVGSNGSNIVNGQFDTAKSAGATGLRAVRPQFEGPEAAQYNGISGFRGLSYDDIANQVANQVRETANAVANQPFMYADQLPPFDITLVGVNKSGAAAKCTLFGVTITNETGGMSLNDLGNSIGMSFVCIARTPWEAIETIPLANTSTQR